MKRSILMAGIALLPLSLWAADTLILRSGAQRTGRFISATDTAVTFEDSNGNRQSYKKAEVDSIRFDSRAPVISTDNSAAVPVERTVPAGTDIVVRSDGNIEAKEATEGKTYPATVAQDVVDTGGNVAVPRGSAAELVVRSVSSGGTTGSPELVLDLKSLKAGDQRFLVSTQPVTQGNQEGLGKNKRTATMVGGGAALGTLLGAIGGGGKGAAIGAIAGAGGGAAVQVLTRGKEVKVPAETQLTFRLEHPVELVPERR